MYIDYPDGSIKYVTSPEGVSWGARISHVVYNYGVSNPGLVIYDDVITQKEEETMKKYWTHSGSGQKYDTKDAAVSAAKKYMDSMHKSYGTNSDLYILEAVACINFPVPAYEVTDLAAATA